MSGPRYRIDRTRVENSQRVMPGHFRRDGIPASQACVVQKSDSVLLCVNDSFLENKRTARIEGPAKFALKRASCEIADGEGCPLMTTGSSRGGTIDLRRKHFAGLFLHPIKEHCPAAAFVQISFADAQQQDGIHVFNNRIDCCAVAPRDADRFDQRCIVREIHRHHSLTTSTDGPHDEDSGILLGDLDSGRRIVLIDIQRGWGFGGVYVGLRSRKQAWENGRDN